MIAGSYPGKYTRKIDKTDFYRDYINTYITRDVRTLINVGNLSNFLRFMQLLAGRVGQLLNTSEMGNKIGVDYKTIQKWFTVLEASYIACRLEPYYESLGKRVIKSPKIYFYDTGLLSYLLGINSVEEIESHYNYGKIFENFIISETIKRMWNERRNEKLYFWRDNNKIEIDLLVDKGLEKDLIEIKSSKTYKINMSKNLKRISTLLGNKYKINNYVLYQGDLEQEIKGISHLNWESYL